MQIQYPKKCPQVHWDTLNVNYPVKVTPSTGISSETIARKWRTQPEALLHERPKEQTKDASEYFRDYQLCHELRKSQTSKDYIFKISDVTRYNKHTSCLENQYIYPPSKKLADRPPSCTAHGTTEMKESYTPPISAGRFITDKDQFKHPKSLEYDSSPVESNCHKKLEAMDTTYEGFERYLDPYLTTSRLYHRPYTAEQLKKISNSKDVVTYYTLADVPWVWSRKPKHDEWTLRQRRPQSTFDREKFKGDFREIRTHNKLQWVPGSFRTEVKDNYALFVPKINDLLDTYEDDVITGYLRAVAKLKTNTQFEYSSINRNYSSENSQIGSTKPICSVFEQCANKSKRLERKIANIK